jgi:hypothetical protein
MISVNIPRRIQASTENDASLQLSKQDMRASLFRQVFSYFPNILYIPLRQDFHDNAFFSILGSFKVRITVRHGHEQRPATAPLAVASAFLSALCPTGTDHHATFEITSTLHLIDHAPEVEPVHSDKLTISACLYVLDSTSMSRDNSHAKRGDSPPRDGDIEVVVVDSSRNRTSSQQQCLSCSPSSVLPASIYRLRDRVQHLSWMPPTVRRRPCPAFPHGACQKRPCSFPPRPKVSRPIIPQDETVPDPSDVIYHPPQPLPPHHYHHRHRVLTTMHVIRRRKRKRKTADDMSSCRRSHQACSSPTTDIWDDFYASASNRRQALWDNRQV